jgi:DNA-binding NarL/FixJ family response regulator
MLTYVMKGYSPEDFECLGSAIQRDLNAEIEKQDSIENLFPLLSNPFYHTDYVFIDIESFYTIGHSDVFELIQTLHTLLKCTVHKQSPSSKPKTRPTKIVVLVSSTTNPNLIKEVLKIPAVHSVLARVSEGIPYEQSLEDCREMLEGKTGPGKLVVKMLRKPRVVSKSVESEISLTPRQKQIMDLICSKGASNKHIARILAISESTVKLHVGHIFKKYGVRSRTQLAVFNRK